MLEDERRAKVRENKMRRVAERQGLQLVKSRRRDPRATGYATYWLVGDENGDPFYVPSTADNKTRQPKGWTLDQIETYLTEGRFPDMPSEARWAK
jgi:hypothetical protein